MTRSVLHTTAVFAPLQDGAHLPADDFEFAATLPVGFGRTSDGLHGLGVSYAGAIDIAICHKGDEIWEDGLAVRTSLADLIGECLGALVTITRAGEVRDVIEYPEGAEAAMRLAQVLRAQATRVEGLIAPQLRTGITAAQATAAVREIARSLGKDPSEIVQCLERLSGAGADAPPTQEEQETACRTERPRGS